MLFPADHPAPTSAPTLEPTICAGTSPRSVSAWSTPTCATPFMPPPPSTRVKRVDRKSTRLNSSHLVISYAVFCLKKKKNTTPTPLPPFTHNQYGGAIVVPLQNNNTMLYNDYAVIRRQHPITHVVTTPNHTAHRDS